MQRVRRPLLAAVLAGAVVLVAACSDPAPPEVPSGPPSAAPTAASTAASTGSVPSPGPSTSAPTPAATSAAAPTTAAPTRPPAGNDPSVEPRRPAVTAPPKKLDEPTRTAGAEVSLVSVRATTIRATTPGDRSGPGVLVRLRLVNATSRTLDTGFTQVSLTNDAGAAGTLVDGSPTRALAQSVRAGRSAEGTYAFLVDDAAAGQVTVAVYVTAGQPVVQFRGRAT